MYGFSELRKRGSTVQSALVIYGRDNDLEFCFVRAGGDKLVNETFDTCGKVGQEAIASAAAAKVMNDFMKKEGVDLRQDEAAAGRVQKAAMEALDTLSRSYSAEIYLPFISGVSHLESKLSRTDADDLAAPLLAKVRECALKMCPSPFDGALILDLEQGERGLVVRLLKDLVAGDMDRICSEIGDGQALENAWIETVVDRGEAAQYPGYGDHVLPSAEALITGVFAETCRSMKEEAPNSEETSAAGSFLHGMKLAAGKLTAVLERYHACGWNSSEDEQDKLTGEQLVETIQQVISEIPLGDMKSVMKDILAAMDDIERGLAMVTAEKREADEQLALAWDKYNRIYEQLLGDLAQLKITPIDAAGKKFDPYLHDAAMHVVDENLEENVVAEELRRGYMFGSQVLRCSVVKAAN